MDSSGRVQALRPSNLCKERSFIKISLKHYYFYVSVYSRSERRSSSLGSTSTSFPSVIQMRTKTLRHRTRYSRFVSWLIHFSWLKCAVSSALRRFCCFCSSLQDSIPFAVIGSNVQVESSGRKFRGRVYPWGLVEGINTNTHSRVIVFN